MKKKVVGIVLINVFIIVLCSLLIWFYKNVSIDLLKTENENSNNVLEKIERFIIGKSAERYVKEKYGFDVKVKEIRTTYNHIPEKYPEDWCIWRLYDVGVIISFVDNEHISGLRTVGHYSIFKLENIEEMVPIFYTDNNLLNNT